MEKLSNNITNLLKASQVEIEAFVITESDQIIVSFSEIPSVAGFPYKIAIIEDKNGNIRMESRQWDTEYDLNRWSNGIYNLDRLRIITKNKPLTYPQQEQLNTLLTDLSCKQLPKSINDDSAIVLDLSLIHI